MGQKIKWNLVILRHSALDNGVDDPLGDGILKHDGLGVVGGVFDEQPEERPSVRLAKPTCYLRR